MPHSQLNPVEATVALLLLVFSPEAAKIVGPYAVIILSAALGASWSLGRKPPLERNAGAFAFFLKIIGTACLVTVGLAELAKHYFKLDIDITWLLAPIGLLIGGVGDDWPKLVNWAWEKVKGRIGAKIEGQSTGGSDGNA